jgi:cell division inhibitor SulA
MYTTKQLKFNTLNNSTNLSSTNKVNNEQWLDIRNIENDGELSRHYANICQQHKLEKKWILMINPEGKSLEQLVINSNIDTSKILKINDKKVNLNLENIATALSKGNCSAVILRNTCFEKEQLSALMLCAKEGNTQCIVLNNSATIH